MLSLLACFGSNSFLFQHPSILRFPTYIPLVRLRLQKTAPGGCARRTLRKMLGLGESNKKDFRAPEYMMQRDIDEALRIAYKVYLEETVRHQFHAYGHDLNGAPFPKPREWIFDAGGETVESEKSSGLLSESSESELKADPLPPLQEEPDKTIKLIKGESNLGERELSYIEFMARINSELRRNYESVPAFPETDLNEFGWATSTYFTQPEAGEWVWDDIVAIGDAEEAEHVKQSDYTYGKSSGSFAYQDYERGRMRRAVAVSTINTAVFKCHKARLKNADDTRVDALAMSFNFGQAAGSFLEKVTSSPSFFKNKRGGQGDPLSSAPAIEVDDSVANIQAKGSAISAAKSAPVDFHEEAISISGAPTEWAFYNGT